MPVSITPKIAYFVWFEGLHWDRVPPTSVFGMAQKKKTTTKKTTKKTSSAKKTSTKSSSAKKKSVKATKKDVDAAAVAVASAVAEATPAVEKAFESVVVYANDIKSSSVRQRVLAWFKRGR
jgi:membrane-bound lytic murein transglycosylase